MSLNSSLWCDLIWFLKDWVDPLTTFEGHPIQRMVLALHSRQLANSPSLLSTKYCQTVDEVLFGITNFLAMEGMVLSSHQH